jgi:hypothetical protein
MSEVITQEDGSGRKDEQEQVQVQMQDLDAKDIATSERSPPKTARPERF